MSIDELIEKLQTARKNAGSGVPVFVSELKESGAYDMAHPVSEVIATHFTDVGNVILIQTDLVQTKPQ
jgi:hypothetical protein